MVETEKLPEGQRAWPISPFKRYSRVRRRLSQQPCTSRMVVSLGLCLLACALASAAGEWQSVDGYRFKALTVSTNEPVGFTSLSPDSTGIDFVTNVGRNSRYREHLAEEIWLHVADFNQDGIVEGIESVWDPFLGKRVPVRGRLALAKVLPWVAGMYPTLRAVGPADVQAMLEPAGHTPTMLKLNTLDTTLFLNTGESLEKVDLPAEAQFAPTFGCSVADFDGDENEDIYLAQNFFNVDSESSRHDAGLGLVMLGDGQGGFRTLSSTESGVANLGHARGSVVSDFNGDGRVDLLTAQNNDRVKLHLNLTGRPGLRVRLKGAGENVQAIGASIRLGQNGSLGPKREIRLGSGYWSQDGLVQLFVVGDSKAKLHIRWADSSIATVPVPAGAKAIVISQTDGVKVVH